MRAPQMGRVATRWPYLFAKQLLEGVGARDCLDDRYWVPAHNGGHCLTQRKTHNAHSHARTLHEIEKACNNGQEVTMLKDPNIMAGTDVDTHTCPLPLTNLDSPLGRPKAMHANRTLKPINNYAPKLTKK